MLTKLNMSSSKLALKLEQETTLESEVTRWSLQGPKSIGKVNVGASAKSSRLPLSFSVLLAHFFV